ncbi:MAG: YqhA family protein [Campylobacterota bacterium]|nr:YqhA family protein [Campylobacterota bacterium]
MLEKIFENTLWNSRFIIILAVVFGLIGAVILFAVASVDIVVTAKYVVTTYFTGAHPANFHEDVVGGIIGAVDLYLIGVVMLLFSFGLYELFISDIDAAKDANGNENQLLAIHSLDQLKDKISKVIVMVLVVSFFQKVGHTEFNGALDMLYLALSITAVSVGLYFLGKVGKK